MTEIVKFITAESAVESEPLFLSMSHEELVQNCIAAQKLIGMQIARAEFHKQRADVVTSTAKILENDRALMFGALERQAKALNMGATILAGRDKRRERADLYDDARKHANSWVEKGQPAAIDWPTDIYAITTARED